SSDFSNWNTSSGSTGQASVETSVVHNGTDSAQFTNASGQFVSISASLIGGAQTQTYTRFSLRLDSQAFTGITPIAVGRDANGKNLWVVYYDANRHGLDVYFWNGAGT